MHYITNSLSIYVYAMPILDSRMYIVTDKNNPGQALVIDPVISEEASFVLSSVSQAIVLLTHSHIDHISGVNWLRSQTAATVLCSKKCAEKITNPHKNLAAFAAALVMGKSEAEQKAFLSSCDMNYTCKADEIFEKETSFFWGNYEVVITHTPGHSDCSQCIRLSPIPAKKSEIYTKKLPPAIVFTGDSLVNGYPVVTRLPGGSKSDYENITRPYLAGLSDDTLIMPGHGDRDIFSHFQW